MNYSDMLYYERNLLSENEVSKIKYLINQCEWQDGLSSSYGIDNRIKKNFEAIVSEYTNQINSIVMNCLDKDKEFFNFCIPKDSSYCLITNTKTGGYYHPHVDRALNGDFSTTVFISDSSEYEGGELCLYHNGDEKKIKPRMGYAVTYKTGTLHRVNEVLSGNRLACVIWTSTLLKNSSQRNLYLKLFNLSQSLKKRGIGEEINETFDELLDNPLFIVNDIMESIMRDNISDNK